MTAYQNLTQSVGETDSRGVHRTQLERQVFPERYDLLERLQFLELLIVWEGGVRTNHLCHCFGISRKRATEDLAYYQKANPGSVRYDGRMKLYVANTLFQPLYSRATEKEYSNMLDRLHLWNEALADMTIQTPGLDSMHYPHPSTNRENYVRILSGIRQERKVSLVVLEHNPERGTLDYRKRTVVPLKLVRTHLGWHLRAYDEDTGFDLVRLNRIVEDPVLEGPMSGVPEDVSWSKFICLTGTAKLNMSPEERTLTNADWGIHQLSPLTIHVRQPLTGLVLHYWEGVDDRLTFTVLESTHTHWQNFS